MTVLHHVQMMRIKNYENTLHWPYLTTTLISMTTQQKTATKRRGRPAINPGQDTQSVSIRLTEAQREKLARLGGPPWVREKIDKAKEPSGG